MARFSVALALVLAAAVAWAPAPAPAKKRGAKATKPCAAKKAKPRARACRARGTVSWRLMRQSRPRPGLVDLSPRFTAPGGAAPVAGGPPAAGSPPAYSRFVSVRAGEWYLSLSRPVVGSGEVTVQLQNRGEDDHNLHLRPVGGSTLAQIPDQRPGGVAEAQPTLAPGRYHLWCDLAGHEAAGMSATLEVR